MKVKYVKSHNNYDFILGQVYEAIKYKNGWLMIEGQLYREEQFEIYCSLVKVGVQDD